MMNADVANALFQCCAGAIIWTNVGKLLRDKTVRGVFWPFSFFFAASGLWGACFYASLHQWHSVVGGTVLASANITWAVLAAYYMRRARQ